MACNDRNAINRHAANTNVAVSGHGTGPWTVYNPGCTGNRYGCLKQHYHNHPTAFNNGFASHYLVCEACVKDTSLVLQIHPQNYLTPGGGPAPAGPNFDRLDSLSPPREHNFPGPFAVAPNLRRTWQTANELLNGRKNRPAVAEYRHNNFLTRLCRKCERIEQTIATRRHNAFTMPPPAPGAAANPLYKPEYLPGQDMTPDMNTITRWHEYPRSTCTCFYWLGLIRPARLVAPVGQVWDIENPRICLSHRQEIWNNLVAKRNANDSWLQNIYENAGTNNLRQATKAEKKRRVQIGGYWRACRCGKEIDHFDAQGNETHAPQILQCLACEGTRNDITNTNGVAVLHPVATDNEITRFVRTKMKLGDTAVAPIRRNFGQIPPT